MISVYERQRKVNVFKQYHLIVSAEKTTSSKAFECSFGSVRDFFFTGFITIDSSSDCLKTSIDLRKSWSECSHDFSDDDEYVKEKIIQS